MNESIDPFTGLKLTELGATPPISSQGQPMFSAPNPVESSVPSQARLEKSSFIDKVLFALTGAPDADLSPQKLSARNRRRSDAGDMAAGWQNPGRQFMGPVSGSGGGGALESIGKLVQLFGGGKG